jgi:hypothetical protein
MTSHPTLISIWAGMRFYTRSFAYILHAPKIFMVYDFKILAYGGDAIVNTSAPSPIYCTRLKYS